MSRSMSASISRAGTAAIFGGFGFFAFGGGTKFGDGFVLVAGGVVGPSDDFLAANVEAFLAIHSLHGLVLIGDFARSGCVTQACGADALGEIDVEPRLSLFKAGKHVHGGGVFPIVVLEVVARRKVGLSPVEIVGIDTGNSVDNFRRLARRLYRGQFGDRRIGDSPWDGVHSATRLDGL